MTMPSERTRALRWAGEFLRDVLASKEVPAELASPNHAEGQDTQGAEQGY